MIAMTFSIYLQEPLLATTLAGDPNSSVSLPFIPGSLLRGALVAQYLREHSDADIAADPKLRALFLDGKTRYLNAYLLDARGRATLPTPAAWHCNKDEESPVYDLSAESRDDEDWQPQAVKKPFCQLEKNEATFYTPARQMNVHTQRDRVMGRAIEDSGAVFRYEALAAGQSFGGVVLCDNEEAARTLESLLEAALFLGGSHNAGYGRVKIGAVKRADSWQEVPLKPADLPSKGKLVITLLSDALLRDANGQYTPFLTAEWLGARLGVTLTLEQEHTFAKSVIRRVQSQVGTAVATDTGGAGGERVHLYYRCEYSCQAIGRIDCRGYWRAVCRGLWSLDDQLAHAARGTYASRPAENREGENGQADRRE